MVEALQQRNQLRLGAGGGQLVDQEADADGAPASVRQGLPPLAINAGPFGAKTGPRNLSLAPKGRP